MMSPTVVLYKDDDECMLMLQETYPVYTPRTLPLGSATVDRAPQPHLSVRKISMGKARGRCATRDRQYISQWQF